MLRINVIKILLLSFLMIINIFLFLNLHSLKNQNEFEVNFLDVGQGNGTLFEYDSGLKILVDSGVGLKAKQSLFKELSFFNRKIDLFFATHYDLDHVGNFIDYFYKYTNSYFFNNGKESKAPIYDEIFKILNQQNIKDISLVSGDIIKINKNSFIEVLFPEKNININKLKDNDSSLILKFIYKDKSILITGDASSKIEKWLVKKYGNKLKSDILIAGHHGSKTSSSEEFLKMVKPEYIIFSAGENNSYHHPNKEILERVDVLGIKYFRTDTQGTVKAFIDKGNWVFEVEK